MNKEKRMSSLEKEYVHERALDAGFQANWLDIAFSLMWFEEQQGVNPRVSVLTQETVTRFFAWMEHELSYSARTRSSIANALGDFLTSAYEKEYLGQDLAGYIPVISA